MRTDELELEEVQRNILARLQTSQPASFPQVVESLRERGISERITRLAAWDLVDRARLDLTSDYKLTTTTHNGHHENN